MGDCEFGFTNNVLEPIDRNLIEGEDVAMIDDERRSPLSESVRNGNH